MTLTTTSGLVATTPRYLEVDGLPLSSFRLAEDAHDTRAHIRRVNPDDSPVPSVNWYSVIVVGHLAKAVATSFNKGDRILVTGTLTIREWENTESSGVAVELHATALGHDLNHCTTVATRHIALRQIPA